MWRINFTEINISNDKAVDVEVDCLIFMQKSGMQKCEKVHESECGTIYKRLEKPCR